MLTGTITNGQTHDTKLVKGLRCAGGFAGEMINGGAANLGGTSILGLKLELGQMLKVLNVFVPVIKQSSVEGYQSGLNVQSTGVNDDKELLGYAGGYVGKLIGGQIWGDDTLRCKVTKLRRVDGTSYVGGFVGSSRPGSVATVDPVRGEGLLSKLLGTLLNTPTDLIKVLNATVATIRYADVEAWNDWGVIVNGAYDSGSNNTSYAKAAGGFAGMLEGTVLGKKDVVQAGVSVQNVRSVVSGEYAGGCFGIADVAEDSSFGLKQVTSDGTAGGFAGRTSYAYLADVKLDSGPANVLFAVVNQLVKALYLDKIQDSNLLKINLGLIKVDALYEGNLIHVNILGLDIKVGLSKKSKDNDQQTDLAIITIGNSSIKLPCDENGLLNDDDTKSNISVNLIKANRTKITGSQVYGISAGYDVYAGGADNNKDGTAKDGRSGGFVGFNDEGLLKNNDMYLCDVVRGTSTLVGPFSGKSELDTVYDFNSQEKVEGENNNYRIYRKLDQSLDQIEKNNSILNSSHEKDEASGWDIYTIGHMNLVKTFETLKNAVLASKSDSVKADLNAYESPAKAVLMSDTKTTLNTGDSDTPEPSESQDPCDENIKLTINKVWKDLNNFDHSRPNSITVTISRTWKDKAGNELTEPAPGYESYKIEGSSDKSKWQEVIKELPAYKTVGDDIYYYTYSITEAKVDGYTTTIDKSKDGFTFTITNRHFPGLPDTGGYGSYLIYLIAVLLFLVYFIMRYKKCKENKKAEKL